MSSAPPERIYIPDPSIVGPDEPTCWSAAECLIRKSVEYTLSSKVQAMIAEARSKALEEAAKECGKNALDSRSPCRHRIPFNCHASCHAVDAAAIRVLKSPQEAKT